MLANSAQLPGNVLRRQDEIDVSRVRRIARHAVVFRRFLILGKRNAARCLDGTASLGAVRSRTRQDDANGLLPNTFRERAKEVVDRQVLPVSQHSRTQLQESIL